MKIVIAPDSFKDALRSPEICDIIASQYAKVFPDAEIIKIPMADGGEGTTEALVYALKGKMVELEVTAPLGNRITASYGLVDNGKTAVMEMAAASGIELVPREKLNPMKTTTFGTGELIKDAIDRGVEQIIIGIGGSATVDGGIGMAAALGYKLLDADGNEVALGGFGLSKIVSIDSSSVIDGLDRVSIKVASDVTNPLTGTNGAARVYGPQKGATPDMVEELDNALAALEKILLSGGFYKGGAEGDGAAGGLGAALRAFCGGELVSGANLIAEAANLAGHLEGASLLITGEGKTDSQTLCGKLPAVVASLAKEKNVPTLLISGALLIREELLEMFDYAVSTSCGQSSLEELLRDAPKDISFIALNTAKMLKTAL